MNLDHEALLGLVRLVEKIADRHILPGYARIPATRKPDGSLVTAADTAAQQAFGLALNETYPDIALLGEEMPEDQQERVLGDGKGLVWCLDPLDGTGNFAAGIPFFCVSLALFVDGVAEVGIVHDPVRGESFFAQRGTGAWLNDVPLASANAPDTLDMATGLVDLKRLPLPLATGLAVSPPCRSLRSFGAVALEWCWLAAGRCHLYLHGGQQLWDYAAGALILQEAGAAGGLLASYDSEGAPELSLQPRIALAAASAPLLRQWRAWVVDQVSPR